MVGCWLLTYSLIPNTNPAHGIRNYRADHGNLIFGYRANRINCGCVVIVNVNKSWEMAIFFSKTNSESYIKSFGIGRN